jgi:hypothetical protein
VSSLRYPLARLSSVRFLPEEIAPEFFFSNSAGGNFGGNRKN